jgi:hypothetical protein
MNLLEEPCDVRDWGTSLGCTEAELKLAVDHVGHSADKVREAQAKHQ